jgi:hypothetical protein
VILLVLACGAGACVASATAGTGGAAVKRAGHAAGGAANPLSGRAMWIWELPDANGGNLSSIVATAHRYGISTLLVKSSDGTDPWSQFNSSMVAALHANGLKVCAWQYVYGNHPVTEAYLGADAVRDGADCLVIDAESEYEGKYISAQTYMGRLREQVGSRYPIALAGFPYIDFHPGFPYSVFLGPNGAQYNAPQMYWKDIGVTTDTVFAHTYAYNLVYGRPIFPLGQVYSNPPARQIIRFRELSKVYGAPGLSWWDWQEAASYAWTALSRPAGTLPGYVPYKVMADLGDGAQGDMVVWAQEHLITAGYKVTIDGDYGPSTAAAVEKFQAARGLPVTGTLDAETWDALLRYHVAAVTWVTRKGKQQAEAASAGTRVEVVPKSASLRERRDELAGAPGRGRPRGR